MANSKSWKKIFDDYKILEHDFTKTPFHLTAKSIKLSVQDYKNTTEKEVRILCKIDKREQLPEVMRQNKLILLPVKNGEYVITKGDGFIDIPEIKGEPETYNSKLDFTLDTSRVGNSEMQHLDFAYASSLIRTFMEDTSLVLTIRGRKYTPEFNFWINGQELNVKGVQTEIDAGYEGHNKVVLIEAKNSNSMNTIIRQLYYPYRQWSEYTKKEVFLLFFEKIKNEYLIWQFKFEDKFNYNSIKLIKSKKYKIT